MRCRILTVGLAIVSGISWADRSLGADPADVDQIVDAAAPDATAGTQLSDAALVPAALSSSHDETHPFEDRSIEGPSFFDVPVASEADDKSNDIEVAQTTSAERDVRLLARSDFQPFIDPDQPDGGVLVTILRKAFEDAGYTPSLDFSGWEADGTHFRRVNIVYPHDRSKDAEYLYSSPIMNVEVRTYRHRDSDVSVDGVANLVGLRVCASRALLAQTVHALGDAGDIDLTDGDLAGCFQGLRDGEHDVVLAEPAIGEFYVNELAIESWLQPGNEVIDLGGLHAVIPRFSPYSTVMMYDLNDALRKMRQSGELEAFLEADEKRRSVFVDDAPLLQPETPPPPEAETPTTDGSRAPKGATM